ncbi:MAG TPA: flagellar motor protein MotB [Candidatus Acidoferrales bacterium]|nr:flagellar motor protein MotB [Candidatus Acidoferrales bacterium]
MTAKAPIIVIKKKGGHGGHHGGAWKVAYADFVTAMMALFIVLWLLNQSPKIQQAVGGYFRDPLGTSDKVGKDILGGAGKPIVQAASMEKVKQELEKAISRVPNFERLKDHILISITPEGLRIDMIEGAKGTFFDSGSPELNADGKDLLIALAGELGKLPNKISVEGHTDATPYSNSTSYSNWELSADRANSARRLLQSNGIRQDQVTQVRGFADQMLLKPDSPNDPSNRRISLIVQNLDAADAAKLQSLNPNMTTAPSTPQDSQSKSSSRTANPSGSPAPTSPKH